MRRLVVAFLAAALLAGLGLWWALSPPPAPEPARLDVAAVLGGTPDAGFARALAPRAFRFPADHGPHPEFRHEWWYFTGNLADPEGRRFGYQLTLFRIALAPRAPARASAWATNQVYMGHFAVTDAAGRRFRFAERFARGAVGLAGARASPFAVWLEDWSVRETDGDPGKWELTAAADGTALALTLTPVKPIVLQGERGLSRKSAAPGNASYYYSIPRLATTGTLTLDGERHALRGSSWLDREWSTSALGPDQAGWDWFALQLDDGREFMYYRLRRRDGSADPASAGVLVGRDGRATPLDADALAIETLAHWDSPRGGRYPARWRLTVPSAGLAFELTPLLADQELAASVRYWEGAVEVSGTQRGQALRGAGYVELTGYAGRGAGRASR